LFRGGFHYSGPAAWNTLPSDLHDITDTNRTHSRNDLIKIKIIIITDLYSAFRSEDTEALKTVLFDRAY